MSAYQWKRAQNLIATVFIATWLDLTPEARKGLPYTLSLETPHPQDILTQPGNEVVAQVRPFGREDFELIWIRSAQDLRDLEQTSQEAALLIE